MDTRWLWDVGKRGGSGGGGTLVSMVVVAVLLVALAWWYLRRDDKDDDDPDPTGLENVQKAPVLTMGEVSDVGDDQVTVNWTFKANDARFGSYQLQFYPKDTPDEIETVDGTYEHISKTSHIFGNLESGTNYVFLVTARSDMDDVTGTVEMTTALGETTITDQVDQSVPVLTMGEVSDVGDDQVGQSVDQQITYTVQITVETTHTKARVTGVWAQSLTMQLISNAGTVIYPSNNFVYENLTPDTEYTFELRDGTNVVARERILTLKQPVVTLYVRDHTSEGFNVSWVIAHPFPPPGRVDTLEIFQGGERVFWSNVPSSVDELDPSTQYSIRVTHATTSGVLNDSVVTETGATTSIRVLPECVAQRLTCSDLGIVQKLDPNEACTVPTTHYCDCESGKGASHTTAVLNHGRTHHAVPSKFCACTPPLGASTVCHVNQDDGITYTGMATKSWPLQEGDGSKPIYCFGPDGQKYNKRLVWEGYLEDLEKCPIPTNCTFQTTDSTDCTYTDASEDGLIRNFVKAHQEMDVSGFEPAANGGTCSAADPEIRGGRMSNSALEYKYKMTGMYDPDHLLYCVKPRKVNDYYELYQPDVLDYKCKEGDIPKANWSLGYCPTDPDVPRTCIDPITKIVKYAGEDYIDKRARPLGIHLKYPSSFQRSATHCITRPDDYGISTLQPRSRVDGDCDEWTTPVSCSRDLSTGLCYDQQGLVRDAGDGFNAYFHASAEHGMIPFDEGTVKWTNDETCPERVDCYYELEEGNCVSNLKAREYTVVNFTPPAQGMGGLPVGNACVAVPMGTTTLGPSNVPHANGKFLAADDECPGDPLSSRMSRYTRRYLTGLPNKENSRAHAMLGELQYFDEDRHFATPRAGVSDPTPDICESKCDADEGCGGFAATRFRWPNDNPGVACRFFKKADTSSLTTVSDAGYTLYTKTNDYNYVEEPSCSLTMQYYEQRSDSELFFNVWPSFYSEWDHGSSAIGIREPKYGPNGTPPVLNYDYVTPTNLKFQRPSYGTYTWDVESKPGYKCEYLHYDHGGAGRVRDGVHQYVTTPQPPNGPIYLFSTATETETATESPGIEPLNGTFRFTLFGAQKEYLWHYDWTLIEQRRLSTLYGSMSDEDVGKTLFTENGAFVGRETRVQDLGLPDVFLKTGAANRKTTLYYTLVSARQRYKPTVSVYMRQQVNTLGGAVWSADDLEPTIEMTPLEVEIQAGDFVAQIDVRLGKTIVYDAQLVRHDSLQSGIRLFYNLYNGSDHSNMLLAGGINLYPSHRDRHLLQGIPYGDLNYEHARTIVDELYGRGGSTWILGAIRDIMESRADWYVGDA
jgi:hypothetical protein